MKEFWQKKYQENHWPWDLKGPHHMLGKKAVEIDELLTKINSGIVPGCGFGHCAKWFADRGVNMTGLDIVPEAIDHAKKLYPDAPNLNFVDHDLFTYRPDSKLNLVYDRAMMCALPVEKVKDYIDWAHDILENEHGYFMSMAFVEVIKEKRPPYPVSPSELHERLEDKFTLVYGEEFDTKPEPDQVVFKEYFCIYRKKGN